MPVQYEERLTMLEGTSLCVVATWFLAVNIQLEISMLARRHSSFKEVQFLKIPPMRSLCTRVSVVNVLKIISVL